MSRLWDLELPGRILLRDGERILEFNRINCNREQADRIAKRIVRLLREDELTNRSNNNTLNPTTEKAR